MGVMEHQGIEILFDAKTGKFHARVFEGDDEIVKPSVVAIKRAIDAAIKSKFPAFDALLVDRYTKAIKEVRIVRLRKKKLRFGGQDVVFVDATNEEHYSVWPKSPKNVELLTMLVEFNMQTDVIANERQKSSQEIRNRMHVRRAEDDAKQQP